jgi:hypothetical protein
LITHILMGIRHRLPKMAASGAAVHVTIVGGGQEWKG